MRYEYELKISAMAKRIKQLELSSEVLFYSDIHKKEKYELFLHRIPGYLMDQIQNIM